MLGLTLSLPIQKSAIKTASVPIQKFTANCAIADLKISSQKIYRCRFRNRQQDCVVVDSEINSQKLCRCRFRNRWPKTFLLSIQKSAAQLRRCWFRNRQPTVPLSAAKNYVAADSKIDSQKLCCYRFRNRHPKTFLLPIQNSAAKLRRCWFRNQQPTVPLPIQKSAAKNCAAADSEIGSDGRVISAFVLSSSSFLVVYKNSALVRADLWV